MRRKVRVVEVLVVDGEPIVRRSVQDTLSKGGYCVHTAANGREAMELLIRHQIQLVVIDWEMPVMNGLEFCKAVRTRISSRAPRLVRLSSKVRGSISIQQWRMLSLMPRSLLSESKSTTRLVRGTRLAVTRRLFHR